MRTNTNSFSLIALGKTPEGSGKTPKEVFLALKGINHSFLMDFGYE